MINSVLVDGYINQSRLYTDNFSIRLKAKDHTVSEAIRGAWVAIAYRVLGSIGSDSEGPYLSASVIQILPPSEQPKSKKERSAI